VRCRNNPAQTTRSSAFTPGSKLDDVEKRGALLFFGNARCVECHAVSRPSEVGYPNEMFSDFTERVIGVPQIAPYFGTGFGNVIFDGPNHDEDFGLEQVTGDKADRYKFRVAPCATSRSRLAFSTTAPLSGWKAHSAST
jgi:cytochrome c peroxidase